MDLYHQKIIDYYNNCQRDYELIWHLKSHHCMHYGYWKENTKTLREALLNMTDKVAEVAALKSGESIIDLGCGVGGPAIFLANRYNTNIEGISISESQIIQAEKLARQQNAESVNFSIQDYCNTDFKDSNFHCAYAIESSCYAIDKAVLLKEAARILKTDGRLVVLDFFWNESQVNGKDKKLMKAWTESWAISDYSFEREFEQDLEASGFTDIQRINCNKEIWPSVKRLYNCFYPGIICDLFLNAMGIRGKIQNQNMWSAYYQYVTFKRRLWNYNIYYAKKI